MTLQRLSAFGILLLMLSFQSFQFVKGQGSESSQNTIVDIIFVLDDSASVRLRNFQRALNWIDSVTTSFRSDIDNGDIRVGLIKYSSDVIVEITLQRQTYQALSSQILSTTYSSGGWTRTPLAIDEAINHFNKSGRRNVPQLMIVVTDGQANGGGNLQASSNAARSINITTVAVGVGPRISQMELNIIAGNSSRVLTVSIFSNLISIIDTIGQVIKETGSTQVEESTITPTCAVLQSQICDGRYDCPDRSDENGCTCPQNTFKCDCYETGCPSLFGCISYSHRCDGRNDCGDMSDERNCQCSDTRFPCEDGSCIDRSKVNNGEIDCVNGDDEFNCSATHGHVKCGCMHDDDQCNSSGRCVLSSWIGDAIPDCVDHSDEPCTSSKVWCDPCWVTINKCSTIEDRNVILWNSSENITRCHSFAGPSDEEGRPEIHWTCITSPCGKCLDMFQCESGQLIDNNRYCDTTVQCTDGSDEHVQSFGFKCSGGSRISDCVLPQRNLYDSVSQCADRSDLCFGDGEFRCFSCLDGRLIVSAKQVCDGIIDCYDMSDECLCSNQSVCNAVLGEETSRCPSNQMHCYNNTDCVDMDHVLCNSSVHCENGKNVKFCQREQRFNRVITCRAVNNFGSMTFVNAVRCNGRPECARMEDECDCEPRPSFCDSQCALMSRQLFTGNLVCDGYVNWVGGNALCSQQVETNCPMRFACKSKDMISIDKLSVCDGIIDCDDHSDENSTVCHSKRFYCKNGRAISIDKAYVCDGIIDCDAGEDESVQFCGEKYDYTADKKK